MSLACAADGRLGFDPLAGGFGLVEPAAPNVAEPVQTGALCGLDAIRLPGPTGVAVASAGDPVVAPTDAAVITETSSPARTMAAGTNVRRFKIPLLSRSSTSPLLQSSISTMQIACLREHHPPLDARSVPEYVLSLGQIGLVPVFLEEYQGDEHRNQGEAQEGERIRDLGKLDRRRTSAHASRISERARSALGGRQTRAYE